MELKLSYTKIYLNLLIIITMLSAIDTFQNIPNWKNDSINISTLPNYLSDAKILDYAISNETNDKIYSVYKNNGYYFYINKKEYINQYREEIINFTSPLIVYNNESYFCYEKDVIKIEQNGTLVKLKELINYNNVNLNNNKVKCLYYSEKTMIIVAFEYSSYVFLYNLSSSNWIYPSHSNLWVNPLVVRDINIKYYNSKFYLGIFRFFVSIIIYKSLFEF